MFQCLRKSKEAVVREESRKEGVRSNTTRSGQLCEPHVYMLWVFAVGFTLKEIASHFKFEQRRNMI